MATYIPNVKDYIPNSEPYTPDFKFISDALANRQDRYDSNMSQLNNLYGQVVYADMSRDDNNSIRDQYTKELAPKIQQVSGLDFSLAQNVDAAQALFKPFYDDPHIVRDLVYTKQYKNELKKAEAFKNSSDKDANSKYWLDGVKYMNFQMDDFKTATREESMNKALPQYYQNPDLYNRAFEVLTTGGPDGKGFKAKNMYLDSTGNFIVEQENGIEILSKPTGRMVDNPDFDPKKKEGKNNPKLIPEMYNPAGSHIRFALGRDPIIQQGMQVMGYVAAREWMETNKGQYNNDIDLAKRAWAEMTIEQYTVNETDNIKTGKKELDKLNKTVASWDSYVKDTPLVEMSDEYKNWLKTIASRGTLEKGLEEAEGNVQFINSDPASTDDLFNKAMSAYVYNSIQGEIFKAAQNYADLTSIREIDENQFALEKYKADRREELALLKNRLKSSNTNNNRNNTYNPFDLNQNTVPGDPNENMVFIPKDGDGNSDFINHNRGKQVEILKQMSEFDLYFIKQFYTEFADELNTDTNLANMNGLTLTTANDEMGEVSTAGLFVPNSITGKLDFYSWDESVKLLEANPDFIQKHYEYVQSGLNNYTETFPSIQKDNMVQFLGDMKEAQVIRENMQTRYDITQSEMKKVYSNVIEKLGIMDDSRLGGFEFEEKPVKFMDELGNIRTIDEIVEDRKWMVLGKILPLLPRELPSLKENIDNNRGIPNSFQKALIERYGADNITQEILNTQWNNLPATVMQSWYIGDDLEPLGQYLYSIGLPASQATPMNIAQTYYDLTDRYNIKYVRRDKDGVSAAESLVGDFTQLSDVITKMHGAINKEMSSVNATPGVTSFNFDQRFYGREDYGDGAIASGLTYSLDESMNPAAVNEALKIFNIAKELPQGTGQFVLVGDFGNAWSLDLPTKLKDKDSKWWAETYGIEVPNGAVALKGNELLRQVNQDLKILFDQGEGAFSKGTQPIITIESFPYGGGKGAEGKQLMKKMIFGEGYARYLEKVLSTADLDFKIPNNTVTIFANRDLFDDPTDPSNQYVSSVGFRINSPGSNGQDMINIDRGGKLVFEKRDGVYYVKEALYHYDGQNYTLGAYTPPTALINKGIPFTEREVDLYYKYKYDELVKKAQGNIQYSNTEKKTNDNGNNQ